MTSRRNNLAQPLTSFIGRERELADLAEQLTAGRCLTLIGPGGVGKTRLALEMARARLADETVHVWHLDLTRFGSVDAALASVLGLREEPGPALRDAIAVALGSDPALLVLDNCEHMADETAEFVEALLGPCPCVEVLATSRRALGFDCEAVFPVVPLDAARDTGDAVRLFVDRARLASPSFTPTGPTTEVVRAICARVEGLPLAIELAAACIRLLAPDQILARLNDRFRLLAGTGRSADPRHRTLRATIDWSYELLSTEEQTLLARLSVFSGGFTAGAARAVCCGEGLDDTRIDHLLDRLVDTSMAYVDLDGNRFRMLDTILEYARERLVASGECPTWRRTHRDWFLAMSGLARDAMHGPGQGAWLASLEADSANLAAALAWTIDDERDAATALRFVTALYRYWELHGHPADGRQWIARAIALADGREPGLESEARFGLAILAFSQGDFERTRSEVESCLDLRRGLGDREGIARALNLHSLAADFLNDFALAVSLQEESLALSRELGLAASINQGTYHLGLLALRQGDLEGAARHLEASIAGWRTAGNRIAAAGAEINLSETLRLLGEHERSREIAESALSIARETGASRLLVSCLHQRGQFLVDAGDEAAAVEAFRDSATMARRAGLKEGLIDIVESLSVLAARRGDAELARSLEACASAERLVLRAPRDPARERELDACLDRLGVTPTSKWTLDEALERGLAVDSVE